MYYLKWGGGLHMSKSINSKEHLYVCLDTHCIENPQILYSEASRATKTLDGCLETGSFKALNAFTLYFKFQVILLIFKILHSLKMLEPCNKQTPSSDTAQNAQPQQHPTE